MHNPNNPEEFNRSRRNSKKYLISIQDPQQILLEKQSKRQTRWSFVLIILVILSCVVFGLSNFMPDDIFGGEEAQTEIIEPEPIVTEVIEPTPIATEVIEPTPQEISSEVREAEDVTKKGSLVLKPEGGVETNIAETAKIEVVLLDEEGKTPPTEGILINLNTTFGSLSLDENTPGTPSLDVQIIDGRAIVVFHAGEIPGEGKISSQYDEFEKSISIKVKSDNIYTINLERGKENFPSPIEENYSIEYKVSVVDTQENQIPDHQINFKIASGDLGEEITQKLEVIRDEADPSLYKIEFPDLSNHPSKIELIVETEGAEKFIENIDLPAILSADFQANLFWRSLSEDVDPRDIPEENTLMVFPRMSLEKVYSREDPGPRETGRFVPVLVQFATNRANIETYEGHSKFKNKDYWPIFLKQDGTVGTSITGDFRPGILEYQVYSISEVNTEDYPGLGDSYIWVTLEGLMLRIDLRKIS